MNKIRLLAALWALLALAGCNGGAINLPPVSASLPIIDSVKLGPGTGIVGNIPIVNSTLPLGEFCDVLSPTQIQTEIRNALGDTAAGFLQINKVYLRGITFTTASGNFSSFTEVGLTIKPRFGTAIPLGTVSNSAGLGTTFTVPASGDLDLLALLSSSNCLSATLTLTGRTPTQNLDLNLVAQVEVQAQVSL